MHRRDHIALVLILSALAGMLLALALPAQAQESAAPPMLTLADTMGPYLPIFAPICGALVSGLLGALKKWPWFRTLLGTGPWGDWLALSVLTAITSAAFSWAMGMSPGLAGRHAFLEVVGALATWAAYRGATKPTAPASAPTGAP